MKGNRLSATRQRIKYVVADWLTGSVAFFIFNIFRYYLLAAHIAPASGLWHYVFSTKLVMEEIFAPFLMLGVNWLSGYYNQPFGKSRLQELLTTIFSALVNTTLIYLILLINDQTGRRIINYEMILMLFALMFVPGYIARLFLTLNALRHFRFHQWEFKALIIGNTKVGRRTADNLVKEPSRVGYQIVGFVNIPGETPLQDGENVYDLDSIKEVCASKDIDQLIIAPDSYNEEKVLGLLYKLFPLDVPIKISPDIFSFVTSAIRLKDIYGEPFVDLTTPSLTEASKNIKRFTDTVSSAVALVVLSPVLLWLAFLVKRSSPGPIIYSQERIGLKQKPFKIYKFRTMRTDAEKDGPRLSGDSDSRITPVGKFLRKYRLDELPQFWNVLKGDMSIVGPRPERAFFIEQIVKKAPYYVLVNQVRPGITSWGMVKYGYASTVDQMVERTRYDLIYMANMSLYVDMKILIYTVKTVVTGKGV